MERYRKLLYASALTAMLAMSAVDGDIYAEEIPDGQIKSSTTIAQGTTEAEILSQESESTKVAEGICGRNTKWVLDTDGVLTITGTGALSVVSWSDYNSMITKIVIEDGITSVCRKAFDNTTAKTAQLPQSLNKISNRMFSNSAIENILIPDSVTEIGDSAFNGSKLQKIVIPGSVKRIGSGAFGFIDTLSEVTINEGVETIESGAFEWSSIEYIKIPKSVTYIGDETFRLCKKLKDVDIEANITALPRGIFFYDECLEEVILPKTLEVLENEAFYGCGIESIALNEGLLQIGQKCFNSDNDSKLKEVTIPKDVISIGDDAFNMSTTLNVYKGSTGYEYACEKGYKYDVIKSDLSGLQMADDGKWYYYKDGVVDTSYKGLAYANNRWWYVENGTINFKYTGMAYGNGRWWYMTNGAIDFKYTGMAYGNGRWWYFNNGAIDFKYTGTAYYKQWWYFSNGSINFKYTGMGYANNNWWMFQNGSINFKYTGIGQNNSGKWYFKNGQIAWKYSGNVTYGGKTYKVQNGKVVG